MKYKVTVEVLSVEYQREYDSDAGPKEILETDPPCSGGPACNTVTVFGLVGCTPSTESDSRPRGSSRQLADRQRAGCPHASPASARISQPIRSPYRSGISRPYQEAIACDSGGRGAAVLVTLVLAARDQTLAKSARGKR